MSHGNNADSIARDLAWLDQVVHLRFAAHAQASPAGVDLPAPPLLDAADSPYAARLSALGLSASERLVLILALAPHLAPALLDPFLLHNQATGRRFSEFGGVLGQSHAGFLPTAETGLFLLGGPDQALRLPVRALFQPGHRLATERLVVLDHRHSDEPPLSAVLRVPPDTLARLLTGADDAPQASADFPAQRITTALDWTDLVVDSATRAQIDMIIRWARHSQVLLKDWGLAPRLKPGYRCLFHGGPGTGKTLTACLLGKRLDMAVYRVDLSRVVSKWLGETEKNLAALFDQAQHRNWLLFFDEADALFGKRTESRSSNDRAANQQIAYLLQRLEDFPGLVILATNQRGHMDEAFARRFQAAIPFPMPDAEARLRLWRDHFAGKPFRLAADLDFGQVAARYELAGGAIVNVLRHACLMAVERDPPVIHAADVMTGIRQELQKEGRHLSF